MTAWRHRFEIKCATWGNTVSLFWNVFASMAKSERLHMPSNTSHARQADNQHI